MKNISPKDIVFFLNNLLKILDILKILCYNALVKYKGVDEEGACTLAFERSDGWCESQRGCLCL